MRIPPFVLTAGTVAVLMVPVGAATAGNGYYGGLQFTSQDVSSSQAFQHGRIVWTATEVYQRFSNGYSVHY